MVSSVLASIGKTNMIGTSVYNSYASNAKNI